MNRPAVLVVDDKENMLKLFAKILGENTTSPRPATAPRRWR